MLDRGTVVMSWDWEMGKAATQIPVEITANMLMNVPLGP